MRIFIIQVAAVAALAGAASLAPCPAKADSAFAGVGSATCAQYAELVRLDPKRTHSMFLTWAQGFMSGLNAPKLEGQGFVELLPPSYPAQAQSQFLSGYCKHHPHSMFFAAVGALWNELQAAALEGHPR